MPKKRRGTEEFVPAQPTQVEQREIQPGEQVDIRFGRLESGEWYMQIGARDDENAIAQTSAFPWDALRGLAKQVKERSGELVAHRIAGEQQCGLCEHVTGDGRMCAVLQCPTAGAEAVAEALRQGQGAAELTITSFTPEREIVRVYGKLEKPRLVGEEDEDELTATVKATGEDLNAEYSYLREEAGNQVVAVFYRGIVPAKLPDVLPGQSTLPLDGEETPTTVEVLGCPCCLRVVRTEGAEPGIECPLCHNGTLEIVSIPDLRCVECQAVPDHTNVAPGDECGACGKGRYAIGGRTTAPAEGATGGAEPAEQQPETNEEEAE